MSLLFSKSLRAVAMVLFTVLLLPSFSFGALTWKTQRIDLTTKPSDKEAVGVFHFVNSGTSTITITSVQASCGCTTASLDKPTYAPGETGEIKAVFTLGDRVGEQEKNIFVVTADAAIPPVALVLHVTIPELLIYSPRLLMWTVGDDTGEKVTAISANSKLAITAIAITSPQPKETKARIAPVEAGVKYQLFVAPVSTAQVMNVALAGTATFADGTVQPFKIYALVR